MIEERKSKLEEAVKNELSKHEVKEYFLSFEKSYKYIRNPTDAQTKEYYAMFFLFDDYMKKRMRNEVQQTQ